MLNITIYLPDSVAVVVDLSGEASTYSISFDGVDDTNTSVMKFLKKIDDKLYPTHLIPWTNISEVIINNS